MRETQIVEFIRKLAQAGPQNREIVYGIGDDCAILRPRANEDLVFTTDFVLEGRHFTRETHTPADIGHKALARSLSDLAAMGSEPVFCLVSLGLPPRLGGLWVRRFYKGLLALAAKYNVTLAGGDLAAFDKVIADVTCCGRVPRGQAILRSGAKPGHAIYVTGALGASAHGLATRRTASALGMPIERAASWTRHLHPQPRIAAGIALRRLGISAAIDVSDGLSLDLQRLCLASQVSADIDSDPPTAPGATLEHALHGGEDYELLFTAPPRTNIPPKLNGLAVTPIGMIRSGRPGQVRLHGRLLRPRGFDHFYETAR